MADSVKQEVIAAVRGFNECFSNGDFYGMLQYFTEDTVWFPPSSDPVVGRKECECVALGFSSSGSTHAKLVSECFHFEMIGEDCAHAMLFVDVFNAAGEPISYFKDWLLFNKVNGKWLIHRFAYGPRSKPSVFKSDE